MLRQYATTFFSLLQRATTLCSDFFVLHLFFSFFCGYPPCLDIFDDALCVGLFLVTPKVGSCAFMLAVYLFILSLWFKEIRWLYIHRDRDVLVWITA